MKLNLLKLIIAMLIPVVSTNIVKGQTVSSNYAKYINQADSLYKTKEYKKSAEMYSEAFKSNNWMGFQNDRYNAACAWALANLTDSAFNQLNILAYRYNYSKYSTLMIDPDLKSLRNDEEWSVLLQKVKQNKEKSEMNLNKTLVEILDSIFIEDQTYRLQITEIEKEFGETSKEMQEHWNRIVVSDSLNLIKVKNILDKFGWLGPDEIGEQGNTTLFLVIQHSDLITQEKYLPMMRNAAKKGKAKNSSLALLEDRVALRKGQRQIYGTQIEKDADTQLYYVAPLIDPDNVDRRRTEMGLGPIANYASRWKIKWDPKQYKLELAEIEKKRNKKVK